MNIFFRYCWYNLTDYHVIIKYETVKTDRVTPEKYQFLQKGNSTLLDEIIKEAPL